jgi:hypothetical protein
VRHFYIDESTAMDVNSSTEDDLMFGCECALPFLSTLHSATPRGALSGLLAFGAVMSLGACNLSPEAPRAAPVDKVSAAFAKVDREIARARARFDKSPPAERRIADANAPPSH